MGKHVFEPDQVHLVRIDGALDWHRMRNGQIRQQHAAKHLGHADKHPAGAAEQHRQIPAAAIRRRALGHETQVIGLLAHLRDQRNAHRQRRAEQVPVEAGAVVDDAVKGGRLLVQYEGKGQHHHHQPYRLRPRLQA